MQQDYYMVNVDKSELVIGQCQDFITKEELKQRPLQKYDKQPYKKMAKYQRNKSYNSSNVRTIDTLKKCTDYLIQSILQFILSETISKVQRQNASIYLYERVRSIRTEYFVQGIINPKQILRIIKILMIINSILEHAFQSFEQKVGLQYLIDPQYKEIMLNRFHKEYLESLKISILYIDRYQIFKLAQDHQTIYQQERLIQLLKLKSQIQTNNYQAYFRSLENEEPIIQVVLWRKFSKIRDVFIEIIKKSFGDIKLSWLFRNLGLQEPKEQVWINLKKNPEVIQKGIYIGCFRWINKQSFMILVK